MAANNGKTQSGSAMSIADIVKSANIDLTGKEAARKQANTIPMGMIVETIDAIMDANNIESMDIITARDAVMTVISTYVNGIPENNIATTVKVGTVHKNMTNKELKELRVNQLNGWTKNKAYHQVRMIADSDNGYKRFKLVEGKIVRVAKP